MTATCSIKLIIVRSDGCDLSWAYPTSNGGEFFLIDPRLRPLMVTFTLGQYFPHQYTLTRSISVHILIGLSLPALDTQPARGLDVWTQIY